jgi:hypothetical protein
LITAVLKPGDLSDAILREEASNEISEILARSKSWSAKAAYSAIRFLLPRKPGSAGLSLEEKRWELSALGSNATRC